MDGASRIRVILAFVLLGSLRPASEGAQPPTARPRAALGVWDTGQSSGVPLTLATLEGNTGWTPMSSDKTAAAFQGDAVMTNGRISAVVRKRASAIEVYSQKPEGAVARLQLRLLAPAGQPAARLQHVALVESTPGAVSLEVSYTTAHGTDLAAKIRLKRGDIALQTEPGKGAGHLRVECVSRFLALPDFFADDIVIDPRKIPLPSIEVPSENFLVHLTGNQDAIAMCVFENRQQDAKVTLAPQGEDRMITGSEVGFEGKKIWVALLDGPGIWHTRDLRSEDTGKVLRLDWKMPFPAEWRVDFTRSNDLTDSWDMLLQEQAGGSYVKPSWLGGGSKSVVPDSPELHQIDPGTFSRGTGGLEVSARRQRWSTVLGSYLYPCWSDHEGNGYLQPLRNKALQFRGPAIVYPVNRVPSTPVSAYTIVDVVRNILGVGPCEYILDLEGQKQEYKGRATCAVRDNLVRIYGQHRQKQQRAEVEKTLDDGLAFVTHIRGRISRYVEFSHQMRAYLAAQKQAHPELADSLAEWEKLVEEIDARVAARAAKIQTPAVVAQMNADFRKQVLDDEGPDALAKCKQYTSALVVIGDNQDELSAECRWVVKSLRQQAGMRMALDPRVAKVAEEIRAKTQVALRNPAVHEGARH
jgi:hypothetical protein